MCYVGGPCLFSKSGAIRNVVQTPFSRQQQLCWRYLGQMSLITVQYINIQTLLATVATPRARIQSEGSTGQQSNLIDYGAMNLEEAT